MTVMSVPILSFLIYFPLLGAVILLFANRRNNLFIKVFTLVISLVELAASIPLFFKFDDAAKTMQFVEKADWFPEWGISYLLGIDGSDSPCPDDLPHGNMRAVLLEGH